MFERRLYYHIDWALLVAILALCALGVAMIYSTAGGSRATGHLYVTQLYALVLGLAAMLVTLTFPTYRRVRARMGDDLVAHRRGELQPVRQPPAIAGMTMTSPSSATAVPRPPEVRASMSPTYTFT